METVEPIRILIADDNDSDRMILTTIIKKQGHDVITAADGVEAVDQFIEHRPDLVLLDAMMPNLDGKGAARKIREISEGDLVPIIFLTSLQDANSLAECLEAGGDDFLSKPYNRSILQAKIKAFYRMRKMHATLQEQKDVIQASNEHLLQEQEVAKAVFDNVAHAGSLHAPNIKHMLSPLAVFNGDVLLAARRPTGDMHVLLGDFTGHGLPAAIGAMPLAEIFYGMTKKGFAIEDVIREINVKLKKILPVGVFCCCCAVHVDFDEKKITLWMGGLPDTIIYRPGSGKVERVKSHHLPLGVLDSGSFDDSLQTFDMEEGDRYYMWSDGIHEARNQHHEMFGEARLMDLFNKNVEADQMFDEIKSAITGWVGDAEKDDDTTLLELAMVDKSVLEKLDLDFDQGSIMGPSLWESSFTLKNQTLKDYNPLPLMLHMLMEVPGLRPFSGQIYTMMTELFSNAFEHGVLGLSSDLKKSPEGFAKYYQERETRGAALKDGYVKIVFKHEPDTNGGLLTIRFEDSGPGFDHHALVANEFKSDGYSGRGLPLIRTLCESIEYFGNGNTVEAKIRWKTK